MQSERRHSAGPGQEWIGKVHVYFSHEQGGKKLRQLRRDFAHFHHHHFAHAERDVVFLKQLLDQLRIAYHEARDGRIGRFRNTQGHDMGVVCVQQLHNLEQCTDFVRQKNRELPDERSFQPGSCFW